ncbi:tetratricopeptide repeat protein [Streptomyces sp. WMMC500]|uniref:tetratricopeptide repeat protein n=1 Tax=Streptomyces sp. WMMC500 TaxID=3015154 RepID=UPI00248AFA08|nr:tetratricopeptide repeat protein [Streptomyces sp. WMMC500]WBB58684.1 tetratricopeptide repeat protein [Streptomyces sp. WMMC500]
MPEVRPSMQDLIRDRRRTGFVGRQREIAAYRDNFRCPPEDPAHRFLFHFHGVAGVGKTSLLRRLLQLAGEQGALTAQVDEAAGSVPEAMEAISTQLARQGHPLKGFDRLLQRYRQRRHEADSVVATFDGAQGPPGAVGGLGAVAPGLPGPAGPVDAAGPVPVAQAPAAASPAAASTAAGIAATAGLAGLGLVPGLGAVAGAMDPQQVAQSLDRWRAALSTRLRSHDDVQLVLSPLQTLTPAFLDDLRAVGTAVPWIALFFDTYERTGPVLDAWLCDVMTSDRYGTLPANVVVTRAGQQRLDPARWPAGDFAAELELELFTEEEARGLIAARGIADTRVVDEILHLSGRLPVLTSMLAETPPARPGGGGDPSRTAVERFLKWVADPVQKSAAQAAALPPALDEDVFRVAVEPAAGGLYGWLRALPFVSDEAGRVQYHDVVRSAMLRVQRTRSPQRWREQHRALAAAHAGWCAELEASLPEGSNRAEDRWMDERWFGHRRNETYHLLCADPQGALPRARRDALQTADVGPAETRRWAQTLEQAGTDADSEPVRDWGRRLLAALGEDARDIAGVCTFLLREAELTEPERVLAYTLRGRERRNGDDVDASVVDFDRALALDPDFTRAYAGRGQAYVHLNRHLEADADFTHCVAHDPDRAWALTQRGRARLYLERFDDAKADLNQAIELSPSPVTWAMRGETHRLTGALEQAITDFDRAVEAADGAYAYAIASRGQCHAELGRAEEALADLDRALEVDPQWAWCWVERGLLHQNAQRHEAAIADYTRALELAPAYDWAYANRALCYRHMERFDEALADLDRALELDPQWAERWAERGELHRLQGHLEQALADFDRAVEIRGDYAWAIASRGQCLVTLDRFDEALAEFDRALAADPDLAWVLEERGALNRILDRFDDSLADYARALEIDTTRRWARLGRARTLGHLGRTAEAHAEIDVILADRPDHDAALRWRGRLLALEGRHEEALGALDAVLAADPGHDAAHSDRAETLMELGRYEEAVPHVATALAADPEDGFYQFDDALLARLTRGPQPSERWAAVEAAMQAGGVTDPDRAGARLVCRAAAGDWAAADGALAELVAGATYWLLLADLRNMLGVLAAAPETSAADRARIEEYRRVLGDLLRALPGA